MKTWNVCPVCVVAWCPGNEENPQSSASIEDVEVCGACQRAFDSGDSIWMRAQSDRRKELRALEASGELERSYPRHPWWDLHEIGQDWDELEDGAVRHEELRMEGR